jgi:hypothetical protein
MDRPHSTAPVAASSAYRVPPFSEPTANTRPPAAVGGESMFSWSGRNVAQDGTPVSASNADTSAPWSTAKTRPES